MTRISVLITNYNYEKFIEEAVESVLAQTVPVHEIILVDDGSTDSSREVIEGIARRHPDVLKPVFTENQGQAGALNAAFENCTGDVVFLLDSDDTWFPEKIATMLPHLDEAGFVQHNLDMDGEKYRSFLVQAEHLRYMQDFGYMDFFSPTSALGFRREVLDKVFPLPYTEELRICADAVITRMALFFSELRTVDVKLGTYRLHGNNGWYSQRFRGKQLTIQLFATLNKCLEEAGLPRIPMERNCQHPRPLGECVQDVDASLAALREMQKEPGHEVPCLVLEGQLLLNQERFEEALATFSRAAAKSSDLPEDVNMILQLEGLLPESGLSDELQPVSPDIAANAFFEMAVCLVRLQRYEEALAAFASVLHHAPQRLEIHLNRSDSFRYLGRFEEALNEVDTVEKINPSFPGVAETRKKVHLAMKDAGQDVPEDTGEHAEKPMNIQIQTTSVCNGKCVMCPYLDSWHKENPGVMTDETFDIIVNQLKGLDIGKICMYLENEPLVDPRLIPRMETVIKEVPFQLMEVSTNAALLSKERADQFVRTISRVPHQIWISFHGKDKRTYEGIMGLDFERTLERVIYLLKLAETTPLNITVRGSGEPMREVLRHEYSFTEAEYRTFWAEQFAKHGLTTPPAINYFRYHDRCGTIQRNNIRLQENVRDSLKGFYCPRVDTWLHFLYTGELCICCMDYHREQIFGDITANTIEEIRKSEAFTTMRDMAFGLKESPNDFICKRCISPNG
ncbi:glycosyltransferase [uncultured Pseudodesulfovibrio sp.]|uniref:glycosyltransferase n=1 Tax=uncultured Pseudodesulfovibrio sp. TaxID=2035858 RepID=UPI0029C97844|nr:glycosyltransferase [uncultured Pseudodesulfovibrio sp.]